ncbi:MAG: hypothetical protein ACRDRU_15040 [Pseudonocardiaceae bacterium]
MLRRGQARRQNLGTAHREVAARVAVRRHGLVGDQVFPAGPGVHDPDRPMLVRASTIRIGRCWCALGIGGCVAPRR